MPKQTDTKKQILKEADSRMRDVGYSNFSYKDIAEKLDIRNAAVHYHFPAKEDLGVSVIQKERRRFKKWIERQIVIEKNAWDKLDWFFSIYTHYMDRGGKLCIPSSLSSSFHIIPPRMQTEAAGLVDDLLIWLTKTLDSGRKQNDFAYNGSPADRANAILGSIQGAMQLERITAGEQLVKTLQQIKVDLKP